MDETDDQENTLSHGEVPMGEDFFLVMPGSSD